MLGVVPQIRSTPASCQWGLDHERSAIKEYEEQTFRIVRAATFTACSTHPYVGGTMDGLVGAVGGIEVKSPFNSTEHYYNLSEARQLHKLYWYQVQGYFWIYGLEWIDFVSYDPRFPEQQRLAIHRVLPDFETIERLKARCEMAYGLAVETVAKVGG